MNDIPKLTPRLRCAANMAREGAFVADVGTDHAYLPIALCLEGRIRGGVASDINDGPVERAEKNIYGYGLGEKLSVIKTDGLCGIETYAPDDVFILGMGGELIARILSDAPWTKNEKINLCLQPMTHAEILREFLTKNGYTVIDEQIVEEGERIYQLMLVTYTGKYEEFTEAELLLGRINIQKSTDALIRLAQRTLAIFEKRVAGKQSAGESADGEKRLIEQISAIIRGEDL